MLNANVANNELKAIVTQQHYSNVMLTDDYYLTFIANNVGIYCLKPNATEIK